jgi:nucleoid-associated protein YgaU
VPEVADTAPAPSFDLVRAEPDGSVLVAGTAGPGERVRIDVDGAEAASGRADGQGGFVLFVDLPPDGLGRVLDLVAIGEDGEERRADGSVVIAPSVAEAEPEAQAADDIEEIASGTLRDPVRSSDLDPMAQVTESIDETAQSSPGPAAPAAAAKIAPQEAGKADENVAKGAVAPVVTPSSEGVAQVSGTPTHSPTRVAPAAEVARSATTPARAPAVLLADSEGVRLLQPSAPRSRSIDRVIVDIISYAADGAVLLEGRSAPPPPPVDSVRVYLDGTAIDSAPIAEDGSWRLPLVDIQSGVYTLRVDQLDPGGRVVSRFETPFKREDPGVLAQLEAGAAREPGQTPARASVITVQPGYTLWGIAADRYGSGFRYVQIFAANDDQIRDPDLIYPGQIFDLPDLGGDN